jgi:hypothetical protein
VWSERPSDVEAHYGINAEQARLRGTEDTESRPQLVRFGRSIFAHNLQSDAILADAGKLLLRWLLLLLLLLLLLSLLLLLLLLLLFLDVVVVFWS